MLRGSTLLTVQATWADPAFWLPQIPSREVVAHGCQLTVLAFPFPPHLPVSPSELWGLPWTYHPSHLSLGFSGSKKCTLLARFTVSVGGRESPRCCSLQVRFSLGFISYLLALPPASCFPGWSKPSSPSGLGLLTLPLLVFLSLGFLRNCHLVSDIFSDLCL